MNDISRSKHELRVRQGELRDLLNEWDPIGVSEAPGWPSDEYDCLLPILGWLRNGMTEADLARRIEAELVDHFGLDPAPSHPEEFAQRVFAWYWQHPLAGSVRPPG